MAMYVCNVAAVRLDINMWL